MYGRGRRRPARRTIEELVASARRGLVRLGPDATVLLCDEGYQSSLAAATLQQLGLERATDVVGGFQAWRAAGLPVKAARWA